MEVTGKNDVRLMITRSDSAIEGRSTRPMGAAHGKALVQQDSVLLSPKAKEVLEASRQVQSAEDMRTEMTADLKLRMDQGIYQIDGHKIAFKMIRESILNQILY